jgi:hypothetical protein
MAEGGEVDAHHLPRRCTLVKTRVGCVKSSTYDLPKSSAHVYGMKNSLDEEQQVGNIITSWVTANPSSGKESSKMIVFSNILAIKNGCVTARAMRKYAAEHPNIRRKEALTTNTSRVDTRFEGPFGRPTMAADEKMDQIIQGKFTSFGPEDVDYPDTSSIKKTGSFPKPRATVASQKVTEARLKKQEEAVPKRFCMKRFQNIKGTFKLPNVTVDPIHYGKGASKHEEILVHHHHDLDAGMYHGEDRHKQYSHDAPENQRYE